MHLQVREEAASKMEDPSDDESSRPIALPAMTTITVEPPPPAATTAKAELTDCDGVNTFTCPLGSCYTGIDGFIGCCSVSSCAARTTCIEWSPTQILCDMNIGGCVICTDPALPSCVTISNTVEHQYIMYCGRTGGMLEIGYQNLITTGSVAFPPRQDSSPTTTPVKRSSFTGIASAIPPTAAASATVASSTALEPLQTDLPADKSNGLSTGAMAGIAIPGSIIFIIILGVACRKGAQWYKRRSETRKVERQGALPRGTLGGAMLPGKQPRKRGGDHSAGNDRMGEELSGWTGNRESDAGVGGTMTAPEENKNDLPSCPEDQSPEGQNDERKFGDNNAPWSPDSIGSPYRSELDSRTVSMEVAPAHLSVVSDRGSEYSSPVQRPVSDVPSFQYVPITRQYVPPGSSMGNQTPTYRGILEAYRESRDGSNNNIGGSSSAPSPLIPAASSTPTSEQSSPGSVRRSMPPPPPHDAARIAGETGSRPDLTSMYGIATLDFAHSGGAGGLASQRPRMPPAIVGSGAAGFAPDARNGPALRPRDGQDAGVNNAGHVATERGISARGDWAGYLSPEEALRGGWRNRDDDHEC